MSEKISVVQFKNREDARELINGMSTDELDLRRNKVRGQYVVYPETDEAEGALQTLSMIGTPEQKLDVSEVKEEFIVSVSEFDGAELG